MPYRTLNPLVTALGALAVLIVILLGVNAWRAARTGPRWKRRLLTTGLALLAGLGVVSCGEEPPSTPLTSSPEWKELAATWRESREIATGERGKYPFDERGKQQALNNITLATDHTRALADKGLLTSAEAELLRKDLLDLRDAVSGFRAVERSNATCYQRLAIPYHEESLDRLNDRLPLLARMAEGGRLKRAVIEKVLVSIERDIETLSDESRLGRFNPEQRQNAERTRDRAVGTVRWIREMLERPE